MKDHNDKHWTLDEFTSTWVGDYPGLLKKGHRPRSNVNIRSWRDGTTILRKSMGVWGLWGFGCEKNFRGTDGRVRGIG